MAAIILIGVWAKTMNEEAQKTLAKFLLENLLK